MWLRLASAPVAKTMLTWATMKPTIHSHTMKCTVRATWRLSEPRPVPNLAATAGACSRPVTNASGAATNTVTKYASTCRPL